MARSPHFVSTHAAIDEAIARINDTVKRETAAVSAKASERVKMLRSQKRRLQVEEAEQAAKEEKAKKQAAGQPIIPEVKLNAQAPGQNVQTLEQALGQAGSPGAAAAGGRAAQAVASPAPRQEGGFPVPDQVRSTTTTAPNVNPTVIQGPGGRTRVLPLERPGTTQTTVRDNALTPAQALAARLNRQKATRELQTQELEEMAAAMSNPAGTDPVTASIVRARLQSMPPDVQRRYVLLASKLHAEQAEQVANGLTGIPRVVRAQRLGLIDDATAQREIKRLEESGRGLTVINNPLAATKAVTTEWQKIVSNAGLRQVRVGSIMNNFDPDFLTWQGQAKTAGLNWLDKLNLLPEEQRGRLMAAKTHNANVLANLVRTVKDITGVAGRKDEIDRISQFEPAKGDGPSEQVAKIQRALTYMDNLTANTVYWSLLPESERPTTPFSVNTFEVAEAMVTEYRAEIARIAEANPGWSNEMVAGTAMDAVEKNWNLTPGRALPGGYFIPGGFVRLMKQAGMGLQ